MSYLLDTHALLWWLMRDRQLPIGVRDLIASRSEAIHYSAVNVYEITLKFWIGKLEIEPRLIENFPQAMAAEGFIELPLSATHAGAAGLLETPHRDPFDRMLAAQALCESMTLISLDRGFDDTGVQRLWR